jgi:hypothetical protein
MIHKDDTLQEWDLALVPGKMTSMHSHDYNYHCVAIQPTQLEVYGEDVSRMFAFRAEDTLGFKLVGDSLEPIGIELSWPVQRVCAAKNIGNDDYYKILFELKGSSVASQEEDYDAKIKTIQDDIVRKQVEL